MRTIDWRSSRYGWWLWALFLLVVSIGVVMDPSWRRGVTPTYREAAANWWAHRDLYAPGVHGFTYFPQGAILFTPFTWPPFLLGEELWRWTGVAALAWGVWRLCWLASPPGNPSVFGLVTVLTIPTAVDSAQVGQANLLFAALMLHAAADVARRHWWGAALVLSMLIAEKPFGLVMILLVAALDGPVRWRLAAGLAAAVAVPFVLAPNAYVLDQYHSSLVKLTVSGWPFPGGRWADLTSLLWAAGGHPSEGMMTGVRLAAAPGALALAWWAGRRWGEPRKSVMVLAVAATYLMLCNPRTQENSYVILGPVVALLAAWTIVVQRRRGAGAFLVAICVGLGFHRAFSVHPNYWLQPLMALIFAGYLVYMALGNRLLADGAPAAAESTGDPIPATAGFSARSPIP